MQIGPHDGECAEVPSVGMLDRDWTLRGTKPIWLGPAFDPLSGSL
jgi:hypothetical protein